MFFLRFNKTALYIYYQPNCKSFVRSSNSPKWKQIRKAVWSAQNFHAHNCNLSGREIKQILQVLLSSQMTWKVLKDLKGPSVFCELINFLAFQASAYQFNNAERLSAPSFIHTLAGKQCLWGFPVNPWLFNAAEFIKGYRKILFSQNKWTFYTCCSVFDEF